MNFFCISLKVFSNEELEDDVRHLALEVIITLCEVGSVMMKKESPTYIEPLVLAILKMMTDIDDDENWSFSDEIVDEDNDKLELTNFFFFSKFGDHYLTKYLYCFIFCSNNVVAESSIDRLACGLGGKIVLPHIIANIPAMLSNADWRYRY